MQKYTKEQALQIIIECAKKYKENLLNRQLLFICSDKNNNISSLEVSFDASNFLHLTGVKVTDIAKALGTVLITILAITHPILAIGLAIDTGIAASLLYHLRMFTDRGESCDRM